MKKALFTAIKAICVGAMTLFAVSCYDDSALNSKLDNLSAEVQAMQAKLAELEKGLNEQASALAALDGKVGALKVETSESGLTTLTLADGSKLVVSANGVVTIVNEDGKEYWAVVDKDGAVKNLGVTVGHDLSFEVDPETFELLVNGVGTGAYVSVESAYVLGNVVETEDSVTLTVGDKTFTLAKKSATEFEIVSGKVYFEAGESKTLPVVVEGMKSAMLASGPKGWTAEVSGSSLTVTAPNVEMDGEFEVLAGDEKGIVEVWVLTVDGTVLSGKVAVAITASPAVVTYDPVHAQVTFQFNFRSDDFGSNGIYYGVCEADAFDVAAIKEEIRAQLLGKPCNVFCSMDPESGNNVQSANHALSELLGKAPVPGVEYVIWTVNPEAEFVFGDDWYVPEDATVVVAEEDFAKTFVTYVEVKVEGTEKWNGIDLKISVAGVEKFFAGYYDERGMYYSQFDEVFYPGCANDFKMYQGTTLYEVLTAGLPGGFGMPMRPVYGGLHSGSFAGDVCALTTDVNTNGALAPGSSITLVVLPITKAEGDLTDADMITYNFTLTDIQFVGGTASVELGDPTNVGLDYFEVPFTSGGSRVYYGIYSKEAMAMFEGANLVEVALTPSYTGESYAFSTDQKSGVFAPVKPMYEEYYAGNMEPIVANTEYVVWAFAVDADGKCGEVVQKEVKTNNYTIVEDMAINELTVSVEGSEDEYTDGVATLRATVTGNPVKLYYRIDICDSGEPDYEYDETVAAEIMSDEIASIGSAYQGDWRWSKVELTAENYTGGVVTFTEYLGNERTRIVHAFLQDANGNFSHLEASPTFFDELKR